MSEAEGVRRGGLQLRLAVALAEDVRAFGQWGRLRRLRPYQLEVARAVARSVLEEQACRCAEPLQSGGQAREGG